MRSSLSLLATVSRGQPSKLRKPAISLDHFIQRQRVLALWREIVRALNKIPDSPTRSELRNYARDEFERHRDVTDVQHIRYLLSTGKAEFDMMRRYIDEQVVG
ncbi:complex 1 protein-domain-containing protein [Aspergillus floccosus]